jgi:ech hydrogenase subunit D
MEADVTFERQHIEEIPLNTLLERVQGMLAGGYRLVQICCTRLPEDHEVSYSFDKGSPSPEEGFGAGVGHEASAEPEATVSPEAPALPGAFRTLRVRLPLENPRLPSISSFYWSAFLYENEMQDLFGVKVNGMVVDYRGKFYKTAVPTPYARKEPDDAR